MLPCINKSIFGIECYGCGAQRALALLIKGDFSEAFFMYPGIYPLLILFLFLLSNLFYKFNNDHKIKIGLIVISALVIGSSYLIKMFSIFN